MAFGSSIASGYRLTPHVSSFRNRKTSHGGHADCRESLAIVIATVALAVMPGLVSDDASRTARVSESFATTIGNALGRSELDQQARRRQDREQLLRQIGDTPGSTVDAAAGVPLVRAVVQVRDFEK